MNSRTSQPMMVDHRKRRSDSCASWSSVQFAMDCSEATSQRHLESHDKSLFQRNDEELSGLLVRVKSLSLDSPTEFSAMKTPENGGRPVLSVFKDMHNFTKRDTYDIYRQFDTTMMMDAPLIPESPDLLVVDEGTGDRPIVRSHRPPLLQPFFSPLSNQSLIHAGTARYAMKFRQDTEPIPEPSRHVWASPKSIRSDSPPPMPIFGTSPDQSENRALIAPQPSNALKMRKAVSSMELI